MYPSIKNVLLFISLLLVLPVAGIASPARSEAALRMRVARPRPAAAAAALEAIIRVDSPASGALHIIPGYEPPTAAPARAHRPATGKLNLRKLETNRQPDAPAWAWHPAGAVTAPILLYHRIEEHGEFDRFRVSPEDFRSQMETLKAQGYTTITISRLVEAVTIGAELPPRPVVITFDDGWLSVHEEAFPVMQELGMVGVVYIISSGIYSDPAMMHIDELQQLAAAGWELGSHTQTHPDLTGGDSNLHDEIAGSRADLEAALGVPIKTIAYPFGLIDDRTAAEASTAGYTAGVGLGKSSEHTTWTLHYLSRREVHGTMDLAAFEALLPWNPVTATG
jgi:peptidoglycan/xylan/chitin deacetylase (PgdA/CDA1 family)